MWSERRRKKKLIVAFHFVCANQAGNAHSAGWTCGQCRRQSLEITRRCGWLPEEQRGPKKLVWARGRVSAEECPTSLIRPRSVEWIEKFFAWKMAGGAALKIPVMELPAKDADALMVLEKEWRDTQNGIE